MRLLTNVIFKAIAQPSSVKKFGNGLAAQFGDTVGTL